MASDITVVVADATQTLAIRAGFPFAGRVTWFTATNLFAATESIQMHHPHWLSLPPLPTIAFQ